LNGIHVEYSSAALWKADFAEKMEAAERFCAKQGWTFGVQVHNVSTAEQMEKLSAAGAKLSFHAPTAGCEYYMNLGNADERFAMESFAKSAEDMRRYNGNLAVFHGFIMTDAPIEIFNTTRSYDDCMIKAYRAELAREGTTLNRDFFGTEEYAVRRERVKARLKRIHEKNEGILWCIENDYPAYSKGLLLAEQMLDMEAPVWLDVSHLWVSCLLFGKDFVEQVELLAASGRVACLHLHANPLRSDAMLKEYRDGHYGLGKENQMRLPEVCRILYRAGLKHWTIETGQASLADLQLLADWLE